MAYRFRRESVKKGVKRIAREQIDKALDESTSRTLDLHDAVHQVRKRCKKIRALLRLVRPQLEEIYSFENARFREAAAELSPIRDAQSIVETCEALLSGGADQAASEDLQVVRDRLIARRQRLAYDEFEAVEQLARFAKEMQAARDRVDDWKLQAAGFKAIADGLANNYRRGRRALGEAYRQESDEAFHEWRKRVKYYWYHLRLLRPIWKSGIGRRCDAANQLGELLGTDHDLAILAQTLRAESEFADEPATQVVLGLIQQRRLELRTAARPLGRRLFADKPQALVRRFERHWNRWRS